MDPRKYYMKRKSKDLNYHEYSLSKTNKLIKLLEKSVEKLTREKPNTKKLIQKPKQKPNIRKGSNLRTQDVNKIFERLAYKTSYNTRKLKQKKSIRKKSKSKEIELERRKSRINSTERFKINEDKYSKFFPSPKKSFQKTPKMGFLRKNQSISNSRRSSKEPITKIKKIRKGLKSKFTSSNEKLFQMIDDYKSRSINRMHRTLSRDKLPERLNSGRKLKNSQSYDKLENTFTGSNFFQKKV